jgi:restriction system protein
MTTLEFLKQQQLMKERMYPNSLQWLLDAANKFKPAVDVSSYFAYKPAANLPQFNIESYRNAFFSLEKTKNYIPPKNIFNNFEFITSNFKYTDYNFEDILVEEREKKESEVILIDESARISKIITDIYHDNSLLLKIEPREFEEIIAEMLSSQGFKVELTKQTRDNGYDILALKYLDGHIPLKFLVECKRYTTQKVGVEIIRSFKDVIATEKANRGIIVTTSYFSKDAQKKQADSPYLLDYKDKDNVIKWVQNYWAEKVSH